MLRIYYDCDSDSLCFMVKQNGAGFCHLERKSCFFEDMGMSGLMKTLENRRENPVEGNHYEGGFC